MGLSSSKTKNEPWAPAQPYILKNLQQQDSVFQSTQPQLEQYAGQQRDTYGRLSPGAEQGIQGAQGLVNSTLHGDYLQGNPYIDGILAKTRHNVTDGVNSQFEGAGRYGGNYHAGILASKLAEAENGLRYQNYADERGYQNQAIDHAQGLMNGATGLLNNAAELPWIGVQAANGAVRQASQGYGTTRTTTPWGPVLGNIAGNVASAFAGKGG
jgi:hypothetical protein